MAKLRFGLIGTGGRGTHGFGRLLSGDKEPTAELVALADANPVRLRLAAEELGGGFDTHTDYRELLDRRDLDGVIVTTPDHLHEQVCVEAFQRGKHVFVDKPLATSAAGCVNVIRAAREADKQLIVGFNLRHQIVVEKLKEAVDAGAAGTPYMITNTEFYSGGRTYMSRWNRLKKYTGGLFIHKGTHDFDVLNYLAFPARPTRVSCFASVHVLKPEGIPFDVPPGESVGPTCHECRFADRCPDHFDAVSGIYAPEATQADGYHRDLCMYTSDKDTHDSGVATIEYDTGLQASHWECFYSPASTRRYTIVGDRGHIEGDMHESWVSTRGRWSPDTVRTSFGPREGGHGGADPTMVRAFIQAMTQGTPPPASGIDGLWSVAIGQAAEISRAEGRVVSLRELFDTNDPSLRS